MTIQAGGCMNEQPSKQTHSPLSLPLILLSYEYFLSVNCMVATKLHAGGLLVNKISTVAFYVIFT